MADDALTLSINAKTDEFVKRVEDAKIKVRSLAMQMSEIDKQMKTESVDRFQKLSEKLELTKRLSGISSKTADKKTPEEIFRSFVPRHGIGPWTLQFSVVCSTN